MFNLANLSTQNKVYLTIALVWSLAWKGVALWKSADRKEKWWFIAFLVVNTLGVLEIAYIYYFSKKKNDAVEKSRR
ncbi:MAG: DUF5652 family protein [bacterium]|nr:DUF5652 family protein [bacterium]